VQAVSAKPGAQRGKNGNTAGDGRSKLKLATVRAGELQQVRAVARDELLVGRHHRLTCLQGATHKVLCRVETADQFNDDVGVGVENGLEVFGPDYVTRYR
jgi:hypothetical protein